MVFGMVMALGNAVYNLPQLLEAAGADSELLLLYVPMHLAVFAIGCIFVWCYYKRADKQEKS